MGLDRPPTIEAGEEASIEIGLVKADVTDAELSGPPKLAIGNHGSHAC